MQAQKSVKAGEVIGIYQGEMLFTSNYMELLKNPPTDYLPHIGTGTRHAIWKFTNECNALDIPKTDLNPWHDLQSVGVSFPYHIIGDTLTVTAFTHGNITRFVNDSKGSSKIVNNVHVFTISMFGVPNDDLDAPPKHRIVIPLMIAISDISSMDELCYDYGEEYWNMHNELKDICEMQIGS